MTLIRLPCKLVDISTKPDWATMHPDFEFESEQLLVGFVFDIAIAKNSKEHPIDGLTDASTDGRTYGHTLRFHKRNVK